MTQQEIIALSDEELSRLEKEHGEKLKSIQEAYNAANRAYWPLYNEQRFRRETAERTEQFKKV